MAWSLFGSNDASHKDDGKSAGEVARDTVAAAATVVALGIGAYNVAHEPLNTATQTDQAGHYLNAQHENETSTALAEANNAKGDESASTSQKA